jgi:hypothetical protein
MPRFQRDYVYEVFNAFHLRYWSTELRDGKAVRVQKSERLCANDDKPHSAKSKAVQCHLAMTGPLRRSERLPMLLRDEFLILLRYYK